MILWGHFNAWMLDERGWSHATRKNRLSTVQMAHRFMQATYGRSLLRAQPQHLLAFLVQARTIRTRNTYLAALKAFFRFARERGYRRVDPTANLRRVREPRKLPRPLRPSDVSRLITAAFEVSPRCYTAVMVVAYAGLRVSEVAALQWGDVDFELRHITVMGKWAKERTVPISARLLRALEKWWANSEGLGYLFPSSTRPGYHVSRLTLWRDVKEAARIARAAGVTPHRLRHTFATELTRQGVDIRHVQELLGHESLASTQIYTLVAVRDLEKDVEKLDLGE